MDFDIDSLSCFFRLQINIPIRNNADAITNFRNRNNNSKKDTSRSPQRGLKQQVGIPDSACVLPLTVFRLGRYSEHL